MPEYEVLFRVDPPRAFGLPDDDCMVVKAGANPKFHFEPETGRSWITREDGSDSHRHEDERLLAEFEFRGLHVTAEDNCFSVRLVASNAEDAVQKAQLELTDLLRLVTASYPAPLFELRAYPTQIAEGGRVLQPTVEMGGHLYVFDNDATKLELLRAACLLNENPVDRRLRQALKYLGLGEELGRLLPKWANEEEMQAINPLRFLQFWKALTTIVGDPSKDSDHQSRPKNLGLGRQFFRHRVQPLHDLRNRFDVAHVADPEAPQIVTSQDVATCREVAVTAILAYARSRTASVGSD